MKICWKKEGKWIIAFGFILVMVIIGCVIPKCPPLSSPKVWDRIIIGVLAHKEYFIVGLWVPGLAIFAGSVLGILSSGIVGKSLRMFHLLFLCVTDVLESLPKYPTILLGILIIPQYYRCELLWVMIILGLLNSARISRMVKAKIDSFEKREFIEAAKSFGIPTSRLIRIHILKCNCLSVFISQFFLQMIDVILVEIGYTYIKSLSEGGRNFFPTFGNMLVRANDSDKGLLILPLVLVIFNILILLNLAKIVEQKFIRKDEYDTDI